MPSNLWTAPLLSDRAPSSGGNAKHNMPKQSNARVAAPQPMAKTMTVVDISIRREPSWLSRSFGARRRSTRLRWPPRQQPGEPRSVLGVMLLGVADHDQRIGGEQATQKRSPRLLTLPSFSLPPRRKPHRGREITARQAPWDIAGTQGVTAPVRASWPVRRTHGPFAQVARPSPVRRGACPTTGQSPRLPHRDTASDRRS